MKPEILTIRNSQGHALYCMYHAPASEVSGRKLGCLLLSPGVKTRVAPHRLYRKLMQDFLKKGISVLRVDFHGLGDSEGELPDERLDTLYRAVQLGRHVDDVTCAMDEMAKRFGIEKFVAGGLCGGAITALLAAAEDPRIVGLYAIGMPVILDGSGQHESENMTRGQLKSLRKRYVRKLISPSSWVRLLSLKSDYRLAFSSLLGGRNRALGGRSRSRNAVDGVPQPSSPPAPNLNPEFVRAMFDFLARGSSAIFIFSGADRLQFEADEKFFEPWSQSLEPYRSKFSIVTIPNANHVLGSPEWVADARAATVTWLDSHYQQTPAQ